MICRNCGLQNPAGFGYCGSCGEVLEAYGQGQAPGEAVDQAPDEPSDQTPDWAADQTASLDETTVMPTATPRPAQRSRTQAVPVLPSMSQAAGTRRDSIVCRNCGRANVASRSVCYQCGRRLVLPPELRVQRARSRDEGGGGRFLGAGASLWALLLAVGAGGLLVGLVLLGGSPQPTAPIGVLSPNASPATPQVSIPPAVAPTVAPTRAPTLPPTTPPTEPATATDPPLAPTAGPSDAPASVAPTAGTADCSTSSAETDWLNLTRNDARQRVPEGQAWCLHQAYVVPYYGSGRIRLLVDGETVIEIDHQASSNQSEYAHPFTAPLLVPADAVLAYRFRCSTNDCAAAIQVGYDEIPAP